MKLIAEILATGDEIRSGALVDSNSAYISERLEEIGVEVVRHTVVGDDLALIARMFRDIGCRADIAVVTGGLGPTLDDLTAEAAAMAADVGRVLDETALAAIIQFFKTRNREMGDSNRKQAMLPEGADRLDNPVGTAPGFMIRIDRCRFFCIPGVPAEMKRMMTDTVLPRCLDLQGAARNHVRTRTISTFGLTESATGERLSGFNDAYPDLKLGLRAKFPEIQVKLYGQDTDEKRLNGVFDSATGWVRDRIGIGVFSQDGEPMEAVVGRLLKARGASVAVAESCTGGLVAHLLTNVPGSSEYFLFSGVTYANRSKETVLGVSRETLDRHGAVDEAVAREMAEGARRAASATYGLATTGIAGPDGGSEEKPVGTVAIGLATPEASFARRFFFPFGQRLMNKKIFAMTALDFLRRELQKQ